MATPLSKQDPTQNSIREFFDWFRQRHTNLLALGRRRGHDGSGRVSPLGPEQHVCLAAGLDTLSNIWSKLTKRRFVKDDWNSKDQRRMGEFLLRHGNPDLFSRCSASELIARDLRDHRGANRDLLRRVGKMRMHSIARAWREDPKLEDLLADPEVQRAGLDEEWLRASRYGEILYKKYRCTWLHEFTAAHGVFHPPRYPGDGPTYMNMIDPERKDFVLSMKFLLSVYESVIASFERECIDASLDPLRLDRK